MYLTLVSSPTSGRLTIGVAINPLIVWLWIGGFIMGLGMVVVGAPRAAGRCGRPAPTKSPNPAVREVDDDDFWLVAGE